MDHVALGRVVDRYEIVRLLGEGGMARVYLVRHATLGTQHALKLLTSASEPVKERLLREGRIQGQLRDPGVVNVTDVIDVDGAPGLVMEFVDGPTLQTWIQRRAPSLPQADAMAREILRVMAAAHAAGLIHRDLKPANILIEIGHAGLQPKIADFGLAKVFATDAAPSTTRSGVMMGTPQYMAPEQIRDAARVDARADVFSLGAILVELVTGRRAFDGDDLVEVFAAIDASESLDPTSSVPDLPARMVDAIRGCLRRNPADRFADAGDVLKAWTRGAEEPLLKSWSEADRQEARALRATPPAVDRASGDHPTLSMSGAARPSSPLGPPAPAPVATLTSAPGALSQGRSSGIEPASTSTPPRRSRAWVAVLAVGLAVATAVGITQVRPAAHGGPHVVVVSDDPDTQARSEQAWALIHAGEIRRASVLAEEVAAAAPESAWAHFTHTYTARSGANAQRERAARLADPSTPDGAFIRLLDDTVHLRAGQAEWDAFEAAHPDFALASFFRTTDPTLSVDEKLRLLDRAAVRLPDSVLPLLARWDVLRPGADRDALRKVIDEAERRFPLSHQVLWRVAQMALDEGDFARQLDAARRGLELAPDDRDLRWQLVVANLHLHEDDAAMAELERLVGVGPELDRAGSISTITYYTFGLGKLRLTRDLLDRCRALTASASGASVRVACDDTAGTLAFVDGDPTWIRQEMEAYRRDVADPAVSEVQRKRTAASVLFAAGVVQVLDGDLAAADATLARLAELPEDGSLGDAVGNRHDLQAMVFEARRTVDPEYLAYIEEAVGDYGLVDFVQGEHYDLAGFPELALAEYRQVVAKTRPSSGSAHHLVGEAQSAVRVAELVADTDPAEARAALEVFAKTWPTADPDHPLVLRARAVRTRLDAR